MRFYARISPREPILISISTHPSQGPRFSFIVLNLTRSHAELLYIFNHTTQKYKPITYWRNSCARLLCARNAGWWETQQPVVCNSMDKTDRRPRKSSVSAARPCLDAQSVCQSVCLLLLPEISRSQTNLTSRPRPRWSVRL